MLLILFLFVYFTQSTAFYQLDHDFAVGILRMAGTATIS